MVFIVKRKLSATLDLFAKNNGYVLHFQKLGAELGLLRTILGECKQDLTIALGKGDGFIFGTFSGIGIEP